MIDCEKYQLFAKTNEQTLRLVVNLTVENENGRKGKRNTLIEIERFLAKNLKFSRIKKSISDYHFDVPYTSDYGSLENAVLEILNEIRLIAEYRGCWIEADFYLMDSKKYFEEILLA